MNPTCFEVPRSDSYLLSLPILNNPQKIIVEVESTLGSYFNVSEYVLLDRLPCNSKQVNDR